MQYGAILAHMKGGRGERVPFSDSATTFHVSGMAVIFASVLFSVTKTQRRKQYNPQTPPRVTSEM